MQMQMNPLEILGLFLILAFIAPGMFYVQRYAKNTGVAMSVFLFTAFLVKYSGLREVLKKEVFGLPQPPAGDILAFIATSFLVISVIRDGLDLYRKQP